MYDIDKTHNSILKIPWFHTPSSHFSRNGRDTMGNISKQKLAMIDSFHIYGSSFLPISCLKYWPNTISRKLPVKATLGSILYTQRWGLGRRLKENKILCHEKHEYKPQPKNNSGIYNNGNTNSLQYIFEWEPAKTTKISYPAVGLSRQKIYVEQSQQQYLLLVGTDIDFVVTN